jgi:hypothetical protein
MSTDARPSSRLLPAAARLLAAAGFLWCIGVGIWIWVTPIRYSGVSSQTWSTSTSRGSTSAVVRTVPFTETRRFADVSLLGPLPLAIPVVLAGLAAWTIWRRKTFLLMLLPTAALLLFCFIAGFSIGRAYVPAGGVMLLALLARFDSEQ